MSTEREPPVILLVDDEEIVLESIGAFLAIEPGYKLLSYTSPARAVADLESKIKRIDLVISDDLMPEMDGIAFLTKMKERFPLVPRILLTGYADKENAIKAINQVGLYQYIEKPWNNDDLRLIIRNGLEKTALLKELQEKIGEAATVHEELGRIQKNILTVFV